ncbi:MAG TPA: hypothetical protein VJ725_29335 [Thermoanaerobaculia bacterium]|nr:hypothetical protein [Thermoanaerobaculia bacterium]
MKWSEYEQRRRAMERQLEADIELLRAAHETRIRALDQLWLDLPEKDQLSSADGPEAGGAGEEAAAEPADVPIGTQRETQGPQEIRKGYGEVSLDIEAVFGSLPAVFDRPELVRALGYQPVRTTFYRAIDALVTEGRITVESPSVGRHRTRYRKAPQGS